MSLAPNVTLQTYLDYAFIRNADSAALQDLTENFQSVVNALNNLAADPNWQHFREEHRINTVQPYSTGTVDLVDGGTTLTGYNALWTTAGIDSTWVLKVDGEDTEYPVTSVTSDATSAAGAMTVPAKASIVSATDWIIITSPAGVVTVIWFDVSGSDTVPAAVTALVAGGATGSAALEVDVSGATTAADVMALIESVLNAAAIGITSNDAAADGSTVLTVTATGTAGNSWTVVENGAHAGFTATSPANGTDAVLTLKYAYVDKGRTSLSGQSYKLIKRFYVLPNNFRTMISLAPASASVGKVREITPEAMRERSQLSDNGGMPEYYALLSVPGTTTKAIRFLPYVENTFSYQYDLTYLRWPTALDVNSPTDIVDWPPELRGLLEKAIEVEVARKNKDPIAERSAIEALQKEMPTFERGAEAHGNHVFSAFGVDEDGLMLDRINIDSSGA